MFLLPIISSPPPRGHVLVLPDQPAADRKHQQERVFGHRDCVRAAVVADGHSSAAGKLNVASIVTGAEQLHEFEFLRPCVECIVHRLIA